MKRADLIWICAVLIALSMLAGCALPVYVRPEMSRNNRPIPVAVQPVAPEPAEHDPRFDDALATPAPAAVDWGMILAVLGGVAGVAGGGWGLVAQRGIGLLRTAVALTAQHADRVEQISPLDQAKLDQAKQAAAEEQERAGVRDVIKNIRRRA